MKKIIVMFAALMMIVCLAACGSDSSEVPSDVQKNADSVIAELTGNGQELSGGWTARDSAELSDEVQTVFDKATSEENAEYRAISLEATQIVAGTNYCFLCEVTKDGTTEYELVYVYEDLEGNAEITDTELLSD